MIKVAVKNPTGSATAFGMMNDHGVIFLDNGTITSVAVERNVSRVEEPKEEPASVPRSDRPVKPKKKG